MANTWIDKAVLYEILSVGLRFTTREAAEALASGEYAEAAAEALHACNICVDGEEAVLSQLDAYKGQDADAVFHDIRREYTRLFVGAPKAVVSPYAGVYYAEDKGVTPVLFVNTESMSVERYMKHCGLERPENTNEPLDHIATELEFLNYLCLDRAGAIQTTCAVPENAYEEFYGSHFIEFAKRVSSLLLEESEEPLFRVVATIINALPDEAL